MLSGDAASSHCFLSSVGGEGMEMALFNRDFCVVEWDSPVMLLRLELPERLKVDVWVVGLPFRSPTFLSSELLTSLAGLFGNTE